MKTTNAVNIIKDESGATAIEYGLIAGLVSVVCIAALGMLGDALKGLYERIANELTAI